MFGQRQSPRRDPGLPLLIVASLTMMAGLGALSMHMLDLAQPLVWAVVFSVLGVLLLWNARRVRREWARTMAREQWLATTLRSIGDAVIATDAAGRITFMNAVAQKLTGWSDPEAQGQPLPKVFRLVHKITREPLESPAMRVMREGAVTSMPGSVLLLSRDGGEFAITDSGGPIRDGEGAIIGAVFVFRDVTEKELGEQALRASQEMFRLITEHSSDFIGVLDLQGRRLYHSASYSRGVATPAEMYLSSSFEQVHPEDRARIRQLFEDTVRTGEGQRTEYRLAHKDGGYLHVESLASVIRDQTGRPQKVLVVSRDITERRAADERVRREKDFSDSLINSLPGIFYLYDARRKLLRWNRNFEIVTGYTAEEIGRLDPLDFFIPEERPLVHDRMLKCLAEGYADVEVRLLSKRGARTPYYVTGMRLDVEGHPCMLGIGIDITARLRAEETLRATMRRLGRQNAVLSLHARSAAMLEADLDTALRQISEIAASTLEVDRASIWFYDDARSLIRCADLFEQGLRRHSAGAELTAADVPGYFHALATERSIAAHDAHGDPRTREFSSSYLQPLNIAAMLDAPILSRGEMIGVICHEHTGQPRVWTPDEQNFAGSMADLVSLSLEIAQRRGAEDALREALDGLELKVAERTRDLAEANRSLQELDRLKSEFLATMSHELRTPLNSIIGFTGILRQGLAGPLNDEQKKQLGMVHTSGRHLLGLINDLLDLSRIESGRMEVAHEPFPLAGVVEEVVLSLKPLADQKGLRLETQLGDRPIEITGDRKRTFQILLNLANNAVKFTERGHVRIAARTAPDGVTVVVSDTGIGIRPEDMERLFEAFRQVDGSARRVYEGTGLGLHLCRKLATLLGGSISAESELGTGSKFTVTLPLQRTSKTVG